MTVKEVDKITRKLEKKVYKETGVILAGVGLYSINTSDDETAKILNAVREKVLSHEWAIQLHGFYLDIEEKEMRFDVVISFKVNARDAMATLYEELKKDYPGYDIQISPDVDVSD